jgi:hypothetical protein
VFLQFQVRIICIRKKFTVLYTFFGGGGQFCNNFPFYYYGKMIHLQTLQVSYGVLFFKEALKSNNETAGPASSGAAPEWFGPKRQPSLPPVF